MTDTVQPSHPHLGREPYTAEHYRRADALHVHPHERRSTWPWLAIAAVALLALVAWALMRWGEERSELRAPALETTRVTQPLPPREPPDVRVVVPPLTEEAKRAADEPTPKAPEVLPEPIAPLPTPAPPTPVLAQCDGIEVRFGVDESTLPDASNDDVRKLADCLMADPSQSVRLVGTTDPTGSAEHNEQLARNRAEALSAALTALGVDLARIEVDTAASSCSLGDRACWEKDRSVSAMPTQGTAVP